jgi:peptide/nickel transport system substrate-binding protein
LYGTLVRLNPDFDIVPELAESWDISPDLMTYTLHLRPDVKWHDGENFTSADVKFTMEAWMDPDVGNALYGIFEPLIDTIDTPDNHTVIVNLLSPSSSFMFHLSKYAKAEMLPKHIWESIPPADWRESDYNTGVQQPIGTGPWMFVEVGDDYFKFEKNPDYYIPNVPKMDYIIYKRIPEAATALAALQNGEVHMLDFFYHYEDQLETIENDPDIQWSKVFRFDVEAIEFNLNHPILSNKYVRQAFSYAFPRETYVQEVMAGFGIPTSIPVPGGHWATPTGYEIYPYDLDDAADALEMAGFLPEYLQEATAEVPLATIATYVIIGIIVGGVVVGVIFILRRKSI